MGKGNGRGRQPAHGGLKKGFDGLPGVGGKVVAGSAKSANQGADHKPPHSGLMKNVVDPGSNVVGDRPGIAGGDVFPGANSHGGAAGRASGQTARSSSLKAQPSAKGGFMGANDPRLS